MLENYSNNDITKALKDMEVQENNQMRQEFIEGLRNGRPNNYVNFRIFMKLLEIEESKISTEKINTILQIVGWNVISKIRDEIFNGVTDKDHDGYSALRKFFTKLNMYNSKN